MIYQKSTELFLFQVVSLRETERKLQLRAEELGMRVTEQENIIRELESALEHLMLQCDRRLTLQQKEHEQKMQLILLHCKGISLWQHLVSYCRKYSRILKVYAITTKIFIQHLTENIFIMVKYNI